VTPNADLLYFVLSFLLSFLVCSLGFSDLYLQGVSDPYCDV
jgi:hypothetical protein